ncbi:hypothetical protein NLJ89_g12408 [Agrocybe chaxingu]|uniref:Uncharacterized protein n=1 Tax=Agrocybe chaxingu TaxID=84603 RepID=A0A9W8JLX1_9AGAR|nr:hypothetical protein NLJ89_g12408 [Agrocybe chaxingu]
MTNTTPTHALEPIAISHRVRWAIFIHNADGHTSELRCSLPVHILDGRVLAEARGCSVMTRQMVLGAVGLARACAELGLSTGDIAEGQTEAENTVEDRELPSYPAHVRDRIANMFLPEAVTVRVSNPWIGRVGTGSLETALRPLLPLKELLRICPEQLLERMWRILLNPSMKQPCEVQAQHRYHEARVRAGTRPVTRRWTR